MPKHRTVVLSLTIVALATLSAGCKSVEPAAASTPVADNTAEVCDAFRHFEVNHQGKGDSLSSFNTIWATDMTKLAGRATDATVATDLKAVAAQFSVLADQASTAKTMDEIEKANPEVFTAGGLAWVSLEARCGKAIVPTP